MNESTAEKITNMAKSIDYFRRLPEKDKKQLYPLLDRTAKRAIDILEAIENGQRSYQSLANEMSLSVNTVKQIVYALSFGGISIDFSDGKARAIVGRHPKLLRRYMSAGKSQGNS